MRDWILSLLYLCRKELLAIVKDPRSRLLLFMPVIVQSLLFGYVATYDITRASYALLDESRSAESAALVARFEGGGTFVRTENLPNANAIADAVTDERVMLVLHIGPRFAQQLHAGETAPVQLILDGRNSNTAAVAMGYAQAAVQSFNAQWRQDHGGVAEPLRIATRAWFNPQLETRWQFLPGLIATLSILQTLLLTAMSVAREREQGTFDQLLVTPLSPAQIMIGKAVPPVLAGMMQAVLVILISRFWFQVPMAGSPVVLLLGVFLFTLASVGIGLALSAFSANMQQAMLYTFLLILPLIMLSGLATPIRNMPQAMQTLTLLNPVRYAIELIQRVYLEGAGLRSVWRDIWPLMVMAVLTLPGAAWLFRHRMQ